jgi:hypothetical protein
METFTVLIYEIKDLPDNIFEVKNTQVQGLVGGYSFRNVETYEFFP